MRLEPKSQQHFKGELIGFDTETADNNKTFLMGCFSDGTTFYDKRSVIDYITKLGGKTIVCTNLNFDFYSFIQNEEEEQYFQRLDRGSRLLRLKTHVRNGKFSYVSKNNYKAVNFIDTGNYCMMKVSQMGKLLGYPKFEYMNIGKRPQTYQEWADMKRYCIRDAMISKNFTEFLYNSFYSLGATPKLTIGSTAISCYQNKYLDRTLFLQKNDILKETFNSYYGGRTEAFARGTFEGIHPFDVNSLYPSVMIYEYPDPNKVRVTKVNSDRHIWEYEGCSDVDIYIPETEKYPLLPFKRGYTLFPVGTIRGWYTHIELRKAIDLGYTLLKVHKTIYYPEVMYPFTEMMKDLWDLRLQYQRENDPREKVVKLLMNNVYGKTGQKFDMIDRWVPIDTMSYDDIQKQEYLDIVGNFVRIKESTVPAPYCIPIWASYTTARARMKMYDLFKRCDPIYSDTDSVFTTKILETNENKLGGLKHENDGKPFESFTVVRPKFYLKDNFAKIKGVSKVTKEKFLEVLKGKPISMQKWIKFKEGKRRGLHINEIVLVNKMLNLEDKKRRWTDTFSIDKQEYSHPLHIDEILNDPIYKEKIIMEEPITVSGE